MVDPNEADMELAKKLSLVRTPYSELTHLFAKHRADERGKVLAEVAAAILNLPTYDADVGHKEYTMVWEVELRQLLERLK